MTTECTTLYYDNMSCVGNGIYSVHVTLLHYHFIQLEWEFELWYNLQIFNLLCIFSAKNKYVNSKGIFRKKRLKKENMTYLKATMQL